MFGNDPKDVAWAFKQELDYAFRGVFKEIVFAVLDHTRDCDNFNTFDRCFQ